MSDRLDFLKTTIPGCYIAQATAFSDERGRFVKIYDSPVFRDVGLNTAFTEQYYTVSGERVVRGLHCQLPPHDHDKLVYCVAGRVFDVVLDLRVGSPTFGRYESFDLSADDSRSLYIPRGLAHGFCVMEAPATLVYNVTSVHAPSHDSGIRWDSIGVEWPIESPIVSERDANLPRFEDFQSPFVFEGAGL